MQNFLQKCKNKSLQGGFEPGAKKHKARILPLGHDVPIKGIFFKLTKYKA